MSLNPLFRCAVHWRLQAGSKNKNKLYTQLWRLLGTARTNYPWQRGVVAVGRSLGLARSDNFLVLGAARSGTSWLIDLLNCHPRIRCRDEILNGDFEYFGKPDRMPPNRLKVHIESLFVRRPGILAGAKVLTYQLDELPIALGDVLELLGEVAIIVLYRQRLLEQYLSLKLAERDGIWHSTKPAEHAPIRLDKQDFVEFAERERRMWQENLATLQGANVCYLSYEQLVDEHTATMRRVFAFLGLEPCPTDSPLVKIDARPLSQQIANYDDFLDPRILAQATLELGGEEDVVGLTQAEAA